MHVIDDPRSSHAHSRAGDPGPGESGPWHDVSEALNSLGETIARATTEVVEDDENRRRMRELSDGLASLARRLGDAAGGVLETPVAAMADRAASRLEEPAREIGGRVAQAAVEAGGVAAAAAAQVSEAGERVVDELRPAVLDALRVANEKFRAVEVEFDKTTGSSETPAPAATPAPVAAEDLETPASITGAFAAVVADKVTSLVGGVAAAVGARGAEPEPEPEEPSIHEWLFPEGAPETKLQLDTDLEPAATSVHAAEAEREDAAARAEPPAPVASGEPEPAVASEPAPEPAAEPDAAPAPTPAPEPAVASSAPAPAPELLEAARVAHERFLAERRIAEEAASASRMRTRSERRNGKPAKRPAPPSDDDATLW